MEELRGVLHYQATQHQLLSIAINKNQTLLEGNMKGTYELEFLSSKDDLEFILPNSNLKLSYVLASNIEGFNLDNLNKEKVRFKNNFKKEADEHFMSVLNSKAKLRAGIAKKYQIYMNKLITSDYKIEGKLRILRNYRIRLLHQYCRDLLREVYQETLVTQLLRTCDKLRLKSNLLPFKKKKELVLYCGLSDFQENLPRAMTKANPLHQDSTYNIDIFEDGNFKTLFYVPHSMEVWFVDPKVPTELKIQAQYPTGLLDQMDVNDPEQLIRTHMVPKPRVFREKNGVKFLDGYQYGGPLYNMLVYQTLIHNIFELEYSIAKLNSSGKDILNLETHVLSGQIFWKDEKSLLEPEFGAEEDTETETENPHPADKKLNHTVLNKIIEDRRHKKHMAEDFKDIKRNLSFDKEHQLNIQSSDPPQLSIFSNKTMEGAIKALSTYHELFYYLFLHGMEKAQDAYAAKTEKNYQGKIDPATKKAYTENFVTMGDYLKAFTGRREFIITYENGFHVNQALIQVSDWNVETEMYRDYEECLLQTSEDEEHLIPSHIRLIQSIYGKKPQPSQSETNTVCKTGFSQFTLHSLPIGYECLNWWFLNLNDIERVFMFTTYKSLRQELFDYSQITEIDELGNEQKMEAQLSLLKNKVQARQLRHCLMWFLGKCPLPEDCNKYNSLLNQYKEDFYFKVSSIPPILSSF